jgi:orotidine-5'-phosphate decarboxylase
MNYKEMLLESTGRTGSIVCMGADPVLDRIPIKTDNIEIKITTFFTNIIETCKSEDSLPGAIKPNYAFYAQHGFPGLKALKNVCEAVKKEKIPLIFDGKRGDIGKTSAAYAAEAFDFWGADALTISPFMGYDSVMPFINRSEKEGKGVYILNRTSNQGAHDFQNQFLGDEELYKAVSKKIARWGANTKGNVGAVVGATSMHELTEIATFYANLGAHELLLIPGVGAQGGRATDVVAALKKANYNIRLARINSSSGITYAYEKNNESDYARAAARAIKTMNNEIGKLD